jgi:hypothetical protein
MRNGGERGIRTPDTVSRIHAFEARAFSHSAISPRRLQISEMILAARKLCRVWSAEGEEATNNAFLESV